MGFCYYTPFLGKSKLLVSLYPPAAENPFSSTVRSLGTTIWSRTTHRAKAGNASSKGRIPLPQLPWLLRSRPAVPKRNSAGRSTGRQPQHQGRA